MDKRVPEVRFKGFTDDWEQQKLGDKAIIKGRLGWKSLKQEEYTNEGPCMIAGKHIKNGIIDWSTVDHIPMWRYEESPEIMLKNEDIIFSKDGSLGNPTLISGLNKKATINSTMMLVRTDSTMDSAFFYQILKGDLFKRLIYLKVSGSSIPHLFQADMNDFSFNLPQKKEQGKISLFLNKIDKSIILHQEKLTLYESLKKKILRNIFLSSNNASTNLRFNKFDEYWKQYNLGDLANIVRGASPRPIKDKKWFDKDSDVGWLRISDVTQQKGRIRHLEQHISKVGQKKTRVLTEPHILLSIAASVGKPVINYVKTGVHDGFLIFLNPKFKIEFMFQWLEMFQSSWRHYSQPGSQVNLNSDLVKNQKLNLPNIEEQKEIGDFLLKIDNLMNIQQKRIKNLQSIKKYFLQKLFI